MANADASKIEEDLMLPTLSFTQSANHDCMNPSGRNADEICENHTRKEFEYNQFFILAETTSLPADNSSEIALGFSEQVASPDLALQVEHNNVNLTYPAHILGEAEDCEVFHGILESGDLVIVPTRRDLESCSGMNDGSDVSPASNDELDADSGIDKQLSDEVDEGIDKATSTRVTISEAQSFLNDIKQNSETRFKILEEVSPASSVDIKADTEHLKKELELIEKFDMKLQQLENVEPSTCSSRYPSSSDGSKSIPAAVLYLRDEKRRWKRQLLLRRALQKLDMVECQNSNKHILRNVRLGPRARYFSLTKEEEDIVEDLLSRPDFVDDETSEGNSTTSSISTAFDLEGEDALRMAEIDERLEQFIEIHSQCGSPSLTSEYR